jgi:hypothetical protein
MARVIAEFTALGFIDRLPVVPLIVRLPLLIVSVVALFVPLPMVSDPETAFEFIVSVRPELITASSAAVGTWPRLQVAASQVVPAEAVFVAACECALHSNTTRKGNSRRALRVSTGIRNRLERIIGRLHHKVIGSELAYLCFRDVNLIWKCNSLRFVLRPVGAECL